VDSQILEEMCEANNRQKSTNVMRQDAEGKCVRVNGKQNLRLKETTKRVVEDQVVDLAGEQGVGGRPRVKEEVKPLPMYETIDLVDPEDPVLFQGDLFKYKAGYNSTFIGRWVQVTEKAIRYYKNRCEAQSMAHKPFFAIPVTAIAKVERVDLDLPCSERDREKFKDLLKNKFEIFLKEDFLDYFLQTDYDKKALGPHHHVEGSPGRSSPSKAGGDAMYSSKMSHSSSSPTKQKSNPKGSFGADMSPDAKKKKFRDGETGQKESMLQSKHMKTVNTQAAWSNREEDIYFNNKRLILAAKNSDVVDQWVEKLNSLVTE